MYIYRWWEGKVGPYEVQGNAKSLYRIAMWLELRERPFRSEVLNLDGTPADMDRALADS